MQEKMDSVKNLMIPLTDYPSINHNATLGQAVNMTYRMSMEKGYRWLIVLDDKDNILGFLTLRNIMEAISNLAPKAGGWMGLFSYGRPGYFYWEGVQAIKDTPVQKCIRPLVDVFIQESDNPAKAAEIILNRRITIVPVINDQAKVVGVIRPIDLLPFFNMLFDNTSN